MCGFAKSACWLGFHLDGISNLECKFDLKRKHFYRYNYHIWNMSIWQLSEYCHKMSMFGFQKYIYPLRLTLRKLIFSQLLLWVSRRMGWKYEFERSGWKGENPSYQATPHPPVMNEWEIDPEAGRILTDMARGVGDQGIWKKYKSIEQTNEMSVGRKNSWK